MTTPQRRHDGDNSVSQNKGWWGRLQHTTRRFVHKAQYVHQRQRRSTAVKRAPFPHCSSSHRYRVTGCRGEGERPRCRDLEIGTTKDKEGRSHLQNRRRIQPIHALEFDFEHAGLFKLFFDDLHDSG